jgi:hypothetical protein
MKPFADPHPPSTSAFQRLPRVSGFPAAPRIVVSPEVDVMITIFSDFCQG